MHRRTHKPTTMCSFRVWCHKSYSLFICTQTDRGIPVGYEPSRSRQAPAAPPTPHKRPPAPSRPRGETAEERRERKAAVKEAKRASREVKKEFKRAFKEEHVRQQTHAACNPAASVLPIS